MRVRKRSFVCVFEVACRGSINNRLGNDVLYSSEGTLIFLHFRFTSYFEGLSLLSSELSSMKSDAQPAMLSQWCSKVLKLKSEDDGRRRDEEKMKKRWRRDITMKRRSFETLEHEVLSYSEHEEIRVLCMFIIFEIYPRIHVPPIIRTSLELTLYP